MRKKRHYRAGMNKMTTDKKVGVCEDSELSLREDLLFVARIMNRNSGVISYKDNEMIVNLLNNHRS